MDEQVEALHQILRQNPTLTDVLAGAAELDLPGWYLTAGCIFQTVWNVVTGRKATEGILDYDLFYFDETDLSWDAEDAVIGAGRTAFAGIPAEVEIRNEARVHLWYEQKFGTPCQPYTSTEAAIDSFAATTCCIGIRVEPGAHRRTYAPHGLSDMFNLVVRPNPIQATRDMYLAKTDRWRRQWPALTVLPWPHTR